mmetsp:Transcript_1436/g.1888  ORF Transcript_1436/g.1888 Transcript_1436/m.1888 type:complete len:247 (-) Transcript_1436:177-917(-)
MMAPLAQQNCCDCDSVLARADPWLSIQHGIILCLDCAGKHRSLGVHISFIRSLRLDECTAEQLHMIEIGGNENFEDFLQTYGISKQTWKSLTIIEKYHLPAVDLWRRRLKAIAQGQSVIPCDIIQTTYSIHQHAIDENICSNNHTTLYAKVWIPDTSNCQLCRRKFTFFFRRHHCRRCGRCICTECSPQNSFRPIPPSIFPSRHCKACVPPPPRSIPGISFTTQQKEEAHHYPSHSSSSSSSSSSE